jgi:hypothetical protein
MDTRVKKISERFSSSEVSLVLEREDIGREIEPANSLHYNVTMVRNSVVAERKKTLKMRGC